MDSPTLQFTVDERLIALYAIQYGSHGGKRGYAPNTDPQAVKCFQDTAWDMNRDACNFLTGGPSAVDVAGTQSVVEQAMVAEEFLQLSLTLPQFAKVLEETRESCFRVSDEWEHNRMTTSTEICDILGFPVIGQWPIFITPPALRAGSNTGKGIIWTHRTDWPNYNTVYLWHEVLHSVFGYSNTEHAVIELATDNELRVRLNGGTYPRWEGHHFLNEERSRLLPDWRHYLSSSPRDIKDFVAFHLPTNV